MMEVTITTTSDDEELYGGETDLYLRISVSSPALSSIKLTFLVVSQTGGVRVPSGSTPPNSILQCICQW